MEENVLLNPRLFQQKIYHYEDLLNVQNAEERLPQVPQKEIGAFIKTIIIAQLIVDQYLKLKS